jgi:hypothetical protein
MSLIKATIFESMLGRNIVLEGGIWYARYYLSDQAVPLMPNIDS